LDRGVVDRLYITKVHHSFVGDVYFPPLNKEDWEESEHIENPADERNPYSCAFLTWQRRIG